MTRIEVRDSRLRRAALASVLLGASLIAVNAYAFGPRHHGGHRAEMREVMLGKMLDRVDASDEQRAQITAIVSAARDDVAALRKGSREQLRDDVIRILTAEEVDRAALEALRAEHQRIMDQTLDRMTDALTRAANVLLQSQRIELAEMMREHMERSGRHHGGPF